MKDAVTVGFFLSSFFKFAPKRGLQSYIIRDVPVFHVAFLVETPIVGHVLRWRYEARFWPFFS